MVLVFVGGTEYCIIQSDGLSIRWVPVSCTVCLLPSYALPLTSWGPFSCPNAHRRQATHFFPSWHTRTHQPAQSTPEQHCQCFYQVIYSKTKTNTYVECKDMWWLIGSAPYTSEAGGPRFEAGICHNDTEALQDHCVMCNNVEKTQGREGNLPLRQKKIFK